LPVFLQTVKAPTDNELEIGEYEAYEVASPNSLDNYRKYDIYNVKITVTSGGPIDVYLVVLDEFEKMEDNKSFKAVVTKEGITNTKFEYENPEKDERYLLIVDNSDNGRGGDTLPTSYVYYEIETSIDERHQDVTIRNIFIYAAIIGLAIIVIAIVAVKKIRRR
jgi:hypothetical protein